MDETFTASTSVMIAAPIDVVWDALVNPETIRQYLHGTQTITDWGVGSPILWRGEWQGTSYEDKGVVLEMEPPGRLRYTHYSPMYGSEDRPENYHEITCDLSERDGQTKLTLAQGNNASQKEADDSVAHFWAPALQIIKKVAEN